MTTVALVLACLALAISAHAVLFAAVTGWHLTTARLWREAPEVARRRMASKPWFVRYAERLP